MSTIGLELYHLFLLIPPLLLIEGFFSGSEIALFSSDKTELERLKKQGTPGADLALRLLASPERILSGTLVMTNICMIGISALIALYTHGRYENDEIIAIAITSPLIVVFGELIPKMIFQRFSLQLAPFCSFFVIAVFWIFFPITKILSLYTSRVSRFIAPIQELLTGKKQTTREELRTLISYGKKDSDIQGSEKQMIRRIFDFKEADTKRALIPLVDVDAIDETASVREALEVFGRHQHSRIPVYSDRIDNIVKIVEAMDLLSVQHLDDPVKNYSKPALYLAYAQTLESALIDMSESSQEMAVVVDEHGGAVGILTFEDIIEEIVGEISDEYDPDSLPYKPSGDNSWLVEAWMEIGRINETLKIDLPEGDYETLSGFLLQQFGRIPSPQDELFYDTPAGTLHFTVREATPRNIKSVLIELTSKSESNN